MTISVNGTEIPAQAINRESANYTGGSIGERQQQAALALTVRELLRQRAIETGLLTPTDDATTDAAIDRLIDMDVKLPAVDAAACREYFDKNRAQFRSDDLIEVRHILLAAAPDDLETRDRQRALAETLIAKLQAQPETFPQLAAVHSVCPSREQGGYLGQLVRHQTVPEFEATVMRLPAGLAERPVETRYGWHVVEVLQRLSGTPLPFEAVHEQIAAYLIETARQRAFSQYLRMLAAGARIRGIKLEAAESPLMQ